MKTFFAALAVCLLVAVDQATVLGKKHTLDHEGSLADKGHIPLQDNGYAGNYRCTLMSDCPGTFDSPDKEYCCFDDGCCTFHEFLGDGCLTDSDCHSGHTCSLNICVETYHWTTGRTYGIVGGSVAFVIAVVLSAIRICCCLCWASEGNSNSRSETTTVVIPDMVMQPEPPKFARPPQNKYSTGADYAYPNGAFQEPPMQQHEVYVPLVR